MNKTPVTACLKVELQLAAMSSISGFLTRPFSANQMMLSAPT